MTSLLEMRGLRVHGAKKSHGVPFHVSYATMYKENFHQMTIILLRENATAAKSHLWISRWHRIDLHHKCCTLSLKNSAIWKKRMHQQVAKEMVHQKEHHCAKKKFIICIRAQERSRREINLINCHLFVICKNKVKKLTHCMVSRSN